MKKTPNKNHAAVMPTSPAPQGPLPLPPPPSTQDEQILYVRRTGRLPPHGETADEVLRDRFAYRVLLNGRRESMADMIFHICSRNFGRPSQARQSPNQNQNQPPNRANTSSPSAYSPSALAPPNIPATTASPSSSNTMQANEQAHQSNQGTKKIPLFFREQYATLIVKGNFMTLAAKPLLVEEGEWMAHQIVEQNRLLGGMIKCVQGAADSSSGRSLCNEQTCPTMAAGSVVYSWVDTNRQPINIPAPAYIKNIMTWVNGKVQDESLFPTVHFTTAPALPSPQQVSGDSNHWLGKTSGFPQRFETEIKNMYKQMFRCYAHLYWHHWLNFWELGTHRELNTCFIHFINVGRIFGLLSDRDLEPMQPLIDVWIRRGDLPKLKDDEGAPASATAALQASSTATKSDSVAASTSAASTSSTAAGGSAAPGSAS